MRKNRTTGKGPLVVAAILKGATVKEAAKRYGVTYDTALKQFRRAYPDAPNVRRNYSPGRQR